MINYKRQAYDLSGKVVIPFFTYGATTYLNESMQTIYRVTPDSEHLPATLPEDLDPDNIREPQSDDAGIDMPGRRGCNGWDSANNRSRNASDSTNPVGLASSEPPTTQILQDWHHPSLRQHKSCRIGIIRTSDSTNPTGLVSSELPTIQILQD